MKRYIILSLLTIVVLASCKKDTIDNSAPDRDISIAGATVAKSGSFVFYAENSSNGLVKIYKQKDGSYVLALEGMNIASSTDLELYLSADSVLNAASIKLFSFKSIDGTIFYELPASIIVESFNYVIIQNDTMENPLASAAIL